jgi:hypothetical protein
MVSKDNGYNGKGEGMEKVSNLMGHRQDKARKQASQGKVG